MLQIKSINSKINRIKYRKKLKHTVFPTFKIRNFTLFISNNLIKNTFKSLYFFLKNFFFASTLNLCKQKQSYI
jgi:hypothetical protein